MEEIPKVLNAAEVEQFLKVLNATKIPKLLEETAMLGETT